MKIIGIGQERTSAWYSIDIFLYNRFIKFYFYSKKTKKPKLFYYSTKTFNWMFNEETINCYHRKWFLGLLLN